MVVEALAHARYGQRETGMGGVTRYYMPGRSGTLTVTVNQESELHQQLQDKFAQDNLTRDQVFPFEMYDGSSQEEFTYTNTYIMQEPNEARGSEPGDWQWVFAFERKVKTTNTSNTNVVGQ